MAAANSSLPTPAADAGPGGEAAGGPRPGSAVRALLLTSCVGWGLLLGLLVWQPYARQSSPPEVGYSRLGGARVTGWQTAPSAEESSTEVGPISLHDLQAADALLAQGNAGQVLDFYARLQIDRRSLLHDQLTYRLAVAREVLGDLDAASGLFRALAAETEDHRLAMAARLGQARCHLGRGRPDLARSLLARSTALLAPDDRGLDDLRGDLFAMLALAYVPGQLADGAGSELFADQRAVSLLPRWPVERLLALAHGGAAEPRDGDFGNTAGVATQASEEAITAAAADMPSEPAVGAATAGLASAPAPQPAIESREVRIIYRYGPAPHEIQVGVALAFQPALPMLTHLCQACEAPLYVSARAQEVMTGRTAAIRLDNASLAVVLDMVLPAVDVAWAWTSGELHVRTRDEFEGDALRQSARESARRLLHLSVASFPDHHLADDCYMALGNLSFEDGEYAQAAATYEQVTRLFPRAPSSIPCRFNRGKALLQLGQRDEALAQFISVGDLAHGHPLHGPAYAYVGRLQLEAGAISDAPRPLMRSVAASPEDERRAIPVLLLSSAYLMAGNAHAANEVLLQHRRLLASSSHKPLGDFLSSLSRYQGATESIDAVHEGRDLVRSLSRLSPEMFFGGHWYLLVGDALRSTGLTIKLQELYHEALPGPLAEWVRDRIREELFQSYVDSGQRRRARELLQESIQTSSARAVEQARLQLARMDLEDGRLDDCLRSSREAVTGASSTAVKADFLHVMGRAYQARDEYHAAAVCFAGMLPPAEGPQPTDVESREPPALQPGALTP